MEFLKSLIITPISVLVRALLPSRFTGGKTQIVPRASVAGRALTVVVAIMSFLACLTAGAVYMIHQSAEAWFQDLAAEVTVQVEPVEGVNMEEQLANVSLFLRQQPGIANARPLSLAESSELLEPWLGQANVLEALPIPRLIAVEIDRTQPPDLTALAQALAKQYKGVSLDDHGRWRAQIRTVTRSFALGGIAILILVAIATIAVIISATRSAMASNREIVEVLHFVGAKQSFIAREFERHFLVLGIRAGLLGALGTALVFLTMPLVMRLLGGGSLTATELKRFVGSASLDATGYLLLLGVIIGVAAICMLTSRYWVDRILNSEDAQAALGHLPGSKFGLFSKTPKRPAPSRRKAVPLARQDIVNHVSKKLHSLLILLGVAGLLLAGGFVVFANSLARGQSPLPQQADGIVVLTGGKSRISEAVKLLAAGKAQRLLISGVYNKTTRAQLIRFTPAAKPLFDCCIDIGRSALNTMGNAQEAMVWARRQNFRSLIIVTSSYHMPRSLAELRRVMPEMTLIPFAVVPDNLRLDAWWASPGTLRLLLSEYVKYLSSLARLGTTRVMHAFREPPHLQVRANTL